MFHPSRPHLFVATERQVRVYDLQRQALLKTFQPGVAAISCMDVHPSGDHFLVGSFDGRVCWFDGDLSLRPYRTLSFHRKAVRCVSYHPTLPLFATVSDDGLIHIFHGQVFHDSLENALIVPVKILRGHAQQGSLGVLGCSFHPHLPWLVTSGADHTLKLWT